MAQFIDNVGIVLTKEDEDIQKELKVELNPNNRTQPLMAKMFIEYGQNKGLTF